MQQTPAPDSTRLASGSASCLKFCSSSCSRNFSRSLRSTEALCVVSGLPELRFRGLGSGRFPLKKYPAHCASAKTGAQILLRLSLCAPCQVTGAVEETCTGLAEKSNLVKQRPAAVWAEEVRELAGPVLASVKNLGCPFIRKSTMHPKWFMNCVGQHLEGLLLPATELLSCYVHGKRKVTETCSRLRWEPA